MTQTRRNIGKDDRPAHEIAATVDLESHRVFIDHGTVRAPRATI